MLGLEFCMKRLTPHQYVVYLACLQLFECGECQIYMDSISQIVGFQVDTIRVHMKSLQRLNFIRYDSSTGTGTELLWVKQSEDEKPPSDRVIKGRLSVCFVSPNGDRYTVKRGEIRAFCQKQNLNRRCVYDILEGKRKQYKNWRVD